MIKVTSKGSTKKYNNYFEKVLEKANFGKLDKFGEEGVAALKVATPVRTGKTADSWYYQISRFDDGDIKLEWNNSNVVNDWANVAVMIQYGHATRNGGYIPGIDYINPAMKPIFDKISNDFVKEVTKV